jgi:hypothetical protein
VTDDEPALFGDIHEHPRSLARRFDDLFYNVGRPFGLIRGGMPSDRLVGDV